LVVTALDSVASCNAAAAALTTLVACAFKLFGGGLAAVPAALLAWDAPEGGFAGEMC
jgi:hypothetical protein